MGGVEVVPTLPVGSALVTALETGSTVETGAAVGSATVALETGPSMSLCGDEQADAASNARTVSTVRGTVASMASATLTTPA